MAHSVKGLHSISEYHPQLSVLSMHFELMVVTVSNSRSILLLLYTFSAALISPVSKDSGVRQVESSWWTAWPHPFTS